MIAYRFQLFWISLIVVLISLTAGTTAEAQGAKQITQNAMAALIRRDYPEALRLNLKAAEMGDAQAQTNLGAMFQDGLGVERNYDEAMRWYLMAALVGHVQAEKNLGDLYMEMEVPEKCRDSNTGAVSLGCLWIRNPDDPNEIEALKWYLRAAEHGHPGAMTNLGRMFANGYGVKKNCGAAKKWLTKAAAAGNQPAMENLRTGAGGECKW